MFLGQVTTSVNENPMGLLITIAIIVGVGLLIFFGRRKQQQLRTAVQERASQLGWSYSGEEAWEHADAASFKIIYSYTGKTDGVNWGMIYSNKRRNSMAMNRDPSTNSYKRNQRTDRLDWRSNDVSIPNMVFLKAKLPSFVNQLTAMMSVDANTFVTEMLSLGLTEADNKMRIQLPFVVSLLTKTSPFTTDDYGLKPITSFDNAIFEAHAVSEEAVSQVLNPQAMAALAAWQASVEARYGANASRHYLYQPMILFYEGGVFLNFDSEQKTPEDYEALVALGAALVRSQQ